MKEIIGKKVKVVYRDGDKVKAVYGKLISTSEEIGIEFDDGRITYINKNNFVRITEEKDG